MEGNEQTYIVPAWSAGSSREASKCHDNRDREWQSC